MSEEISITPNSNSPRKSSFTVFNGLFTAMAIVAVIYHLSLVHVNFWSTTHHYIIHLAMMILIAGIVSICDSVSVESTLRIKLRIGFAALALILGLGAMAYFAINAEELELAQPFISQEAMLVTALAIVSVMILSWIHWGPFFTIMTLGSIAYFVWGHLISGPFGHPEYEMDYIMSYLGGSLSFGMFGITIKSSADVIFIFMIFGSLFRWTGVLTLFLEIGKLVGNVVKGGAAFPAVIGSSFVGTVTGAAVANVILTGSATIPMMKKTGFKPSQAAAIEAVSSTGGQIMPPIMGAAAFLMAGFMEVPYMEIMQKAVFPALIFYISVAVGVFFLVRSSGLNPPKMDVSIKLILRLLPVFVIPMSAVIWLLIGHYSPGFAAFSGIATMVIVSVLQKETRPSGAQWIEGIRDAAKTGAQIGVLLALIGLLAQVALTTNIGTKLSQSILMFTGNELVPVLIISAFTALVLGLGLPTPIAYVIMFVTVVPLMIDVGVGMYAANFFAFYFAILSTLTPPIGLSVLAASRIAGCGFWQATRHSVQLSFIAYLLPFAFVFVPSMLDFPFGVEKEAWIAIACLVLSIFSGASCLYGYTTRHEGLVVRLMLGFVTFVGISYIFTPKTEFLIVFLGLFVATYSLPLFAKKPKAAI